MDVERNRAAGAVPAAAAVEPADAASFSVAFVCTGNRFRSVIAEATFRAAARDLPVHVCSFGTIDIGAVEPLPGALREAEALGLEISTHLARCLTTSDLAETPLVLGFELGHAVAAVEAGGARPGTVFVLPELVSILDRIGIVPHADPIDRALDNVARADAHRREEPRLRLADEIPDPAGLAQSAQRRIASAVHAGTVAVARLLLGVEAPGTAATLPDSRRIL